MDGIEKSNLVEKYQPLWGIVKLFSKNICGFYMFNDVQDQMKSIILL